MKQLSILILCLTSWSLYAQINVAAEVLSSTGNSTRRDNICINSALGETVIYSKTKGNVYVGQGFQSISQLFIITSVQINERNVDIKLYPNPVSDVCYIESTEPIETLMIYNTQGKILASIRNPGSQITAFEGLTPGIYFLHGTINSEQFLIGKVLKVNP